MFTKKQKMIKTLQLLLLTLTTFAFAQDGTIDTSFNPATGANNGVVLTATKQADGKIIVGGDFTILNNTPYSKLGRLNADGTLDTTFTTGTGFNNTVNAVTVQADGKIIVVGNFTMYNGTATNRIIRLNSNGTLDTSFNIGSGANMAIHAATLQTDGKIIIVGEFVQFNETSKNKIARLNADGTIDTTFTTAVVNDTIYSCIIQSDGKIVVAGKFTSFSTVPSKRIVRLDANGTVDATFNTSNAADGIIKTMCLQPDGKILIGGYFTTYNGTAAKNIARLNADSTLDVTFNTGTGLDSIFTTYINSIVRQSDGKLLIGGVFESYNGTNCERIARLNSNGTIDAAFSAGTYSGTDAAVNAIVIQSNGKILLGGAFGNCKGFIRNQLASLNTNGIIDTSFYPYFVNGNGPDNLVTAITALPDGKIFIGGYFETYNGITVKNFAKLKADGTIDPTFNTTGTGPNSGVQKILVLPSNKIMIVGDFTSYNGITANRIARLNADGTLDTTFNVGGSGSPSAIHTIALQADGKMIIGGDFYNYNGSPGDFIARINANGSKDTSFNNRPGGSVWSLLIQADGKIIVGGTFATYNDTVPTGAIIRLNSDSTLDTTFNTGGTGATGGGFQVISTSRQTDGKIIVTGAFNAYNNIPNRNIVRINSNGTLDTSFNCTTVSVGAVYDSAMQNDGKILIGGAISSPFNGFTGKSIMRLNSDGTLDTSLIQGTGFGAAVRALKIQTDGKILVGGNFVDYNGMPVNYFTRLNATSTLNVSDFSTKSTINLYPNPAKDYLHFSLPMGITSTSYEVFDITGKKIDANLLENTTINVSNYTSGIYFLHLKTDRGVFTCKFIKN